MGHGQVGNEGFQCEPLGRRKHSHLGELPLQGRALGWPQGGDHCHPVADNRILKANNTGRARDRALQGRRATGLIAHHPHQRCLRRRGPPEGDGPVRARRIRPKRRSRRRFNPNRGVVRPLVGFGRSHLPQPSGQGRDIQAGGHIENDPDGATTPEDGGPRGIREGKGENRLSLAKGDIRLDDPPLRQRIRPLGKLGRRLDERRLFRRGAFRGWIRRFGLGGQVHPDRTVSDARLHVGVLGKGQDQLGAPACLGDPHRLDPPGR